MQQEIARLQPEEAVAKTGEETSLASEPAVPVTIDTKPSRDQTNHELAPNTKEVNSEMKPEEDTSAGNEVLEPTAIYGCEPKVEADEQ